MAKVAVCVPNPGIIQRLTTRCLIQLTKRTPLEMIYLDPLCTYIDITRCELIQEAGYQGCTHALFIDADMTFPANALLRLLEHDKLVVAANYLKRRDGKTSVSLALDGSGYLESKGKTGLEEVLGIGFGVALLDLRVFQKIKSPWFVYSDRYEGEDYCFCHHCVDAGVPIYVDHDLSQEIGHIGTIEWRYDGEQL